MTVEIITWDTLFALYKAFVDDSEQLTVDEVNRCILEYATATSQMFVDVLSALHAEYLSTPL